MSGARERWTALLEILGERGTLGVTEAAERLGCSAATVRRDMDELAGQNLLTRTRGGAVHSAVAYDLPLRYKVSRRADEKLRIARAAAGLVPPGASVGLNGGTTTSEVARELAARAQPAMDAREWGLTVVTNAINIANELVVRPHVKTVVTGGVARPHSYELTGPQADEVLRTLALDFVFLGVDALDPRFGAATHDEGEARTNRVLAERAETVVVVADSSKLGRRAFAVVCDTAAVHALITDRGADPGLVAAFEEAGVAVTLV
ncbi:DeoR/GlpR family DNA-binding transcription regulator (plasmid) [Streptomyces sp. BI20]|uniref:DeoR/GlpR family DNA-binding transcription regulator n=1 Tax=Streptomyces sp. BI20 TaxID=3403460 RepID=UPI003C74CC03